MTRIWILASALVATALPVNASTPDTGCVSTVSFEVVTSLGPVMEPAVAACEGMTCDADGCQGTFTCRLAAGCRVEGSVDASANAGDWSAGLWLDGSHQGTCGVTSLFGGSCGVSASKDVPQGATYTVTCLFGALAAVDVTYACGVAESA